MSDVATLVEYRLVRPDGTVLWTCIVPNGYSADWRPQARPETPWRYEAREPGGDWTLIAEQLTP